MGTWSRIGIKNADNTITSVCCHYDGYLDHCGRLLLDHWSDSKKLKNLIEMGDMCILGSEIGTKHTIDVYKYSENFKNDFIPRPKNSCSFYKRDGAKTRLAATQNFYPVTDYMYDYCHKEEYNYYFDPDDNKWYVNYFRTREFFIPLKQAMKYEKDIAKMEEEMFENRVFPSYTQKVICP